MTIWKSKEKLYLYIRNTHIENLIFNYTINIGNFILEHKNSIGYCVQKNSVFLKISNTKIKMIFRLFKKKDFEYVSKGWNSPTPHGILVIKTYLFSFQNKSDGRIYIKSL